MELDNLRAEVIPINRKNFKPLIYNFSNYLVKKIGEDYQLLFNSLKIKTETREIEVDEKNLKTELDKKKGNSKNGLKDDAPNDDLSDFDILDDM